MMMTSAAATRTTGTTGTTRTTAATHTPSKRARRGTSPAAAPAPRGVPTQAASSLTRSAPSEAVSTAAEHSSAMDSYLSNPTAPLPKQIEQLTHTDWWGHLAATEQNSVRAESSNLVASLITYGQSRISIGKALTMIHTVLEPHGVFVKYLANFNFSLTTAYRYMAIYRNARASLPEVVLREAMASGIDIVGSRDDRPLGQYTEAVAAAPPIPKNPTPEKARAWLARVQEIKAEERKPPTRAGIDARDLAASGGGGDLDSDVDDAAGGGLQSFAETDIEPRLKETYLVVRRVIRKLAPDVRGEFIVRLGGLAMTEFGIRGPLSFKPVPIPEDWLRSRGRPKLA